MRTKITPQDSVGMPNDPTRVVYPGIVERI